MCLVLIYFTERQLINDLTTASNIQNMAEQNKAEIFCQEFQACLNWDA